MAIVLSTVVLWEVWGRAELLWIGVAALVAAVDAGIRTRRPATSPAVPLAVDTAAVGLAMVISGLPLPVMGAPLAYLLTAAILLLPPIAALGAVAHTTAWLMVAFFAASWSPIEWSPGQELILGAIATAVFFAEMALLVSTAARALRQRQETLEELVRSKDEFVASVSHELRTPLTAVLGFAEELRERWTNLEPTEVTELLDLVVSQGLDVAHIVDDLLVAARLQVGTVSIVASEIYLSETLKAVMDSVRLEGLIVRIEGEARCQGDPVRVRQILRNLLSNAVRHGGADIRITLHSDGDRAMVEVSDDGPGIPGEETDKLFLPYERFHHDRGKPDSVGLGLYVAHSLARLMHGDLTYERRQGRSVFTMVLPASPSHEASQGSD